MKHSPTLSMHYVRYSRFSTGGLLPPPTVVIAMTSKMCYFNVCFGFNYQVVNRLTAEKTEKTAESRREHSMSSAYSLCSPRLKAGILSA